MEDKLLNKLREDALSLFYVGIKAASSYNLIPNNMLLEENILTIRLLILDGEYEKVIVKLLKLEPKCDFLKGERDVLLASAYSYKSDWENALLYNIRANAFFHACQIDSKIFNMAYKKFGNDALGE